MPTPTIAPVTGGTSAEVTPITRILEQLQNDRYNLEDACDAADLQNRKTWNAAMNHAIGVVARGSGVSGVVQFDLSDTENS